MKICLVTSELAPLAKSGGLADVSSALSRYLHEAGHDVRVVMPCYSGIDTTGLHITPVDYLQDIPLSIGTHRYHFSIDTATLPGSTLSIYLLRCPELYGRQTLYTHDADEHIRFILLSRAAIEMCQRMNFAPDIFHCHDWHAALIPLLLKARYHWDALFAATRSVLTIHNIGYQGVFGAGILKEIELAGSPHWFDAEDLRNNRINYLKTGVVHADMVTTVSPTYASEIQGSEYGMGLQEQIRARSGSLVGILNGVDYTEWNPATDPLIEQPYTHRSQKGKAACKLALMQETGLAGDTARPLIGIISRLTPQKGIDLMQNVLPAMLEKRDFAIVALGSGESRYEAFFNWLQRHYGHNVYFYRGYNHALAHRIEAGSDLFLMPSHYEPCGLNQMYSLKYGTVPIVRQTGGLADSVQAVDVASGEGTGIVFRDYDNTGLEWALNTALDLYSNKVVWRKVVRNGMTQDFSWEKQGKLYVDLFQKLRISA